MRSLLPILISLSLLRMFNCSWLKVSNLSYAVTPWVLWWWWGSYFSRQQWQEIPFDFLWILYRVSAFIRFPQYFTSGFPSPFYFFFHFSFFFIPFHFFSSFNFPRLLVVSIFFSFPFLSLSHSFIFHFLFLSFSFSSFFFVFLPLFVSSFVH